MVLQQALHPVTEKLGCVDLNTQWICVLRGVCHGILGGMRRCLELSIVHERCLGPRVPAQHPHPSS